MKSFGLFIRGSSKSGNDSKQKSSEIAVVKSRKGKRDGKLDSFNLCMTYSKTVLVYFYCFKIVILGAHIRDQPADSFDVEPDFNQNCTQ